MSSLIIYKDEETPRLFFRISLNVSNDGYTEYLQKYYTCLLQNRSSSYVLW